MPPSGHDTKLFINYRREDTAPYAGRLYDRLVAHFGENQVFMDIDQIEPGEDFVEVINHKVGACEIAIISIGPNWLSATDAGGQRRIDDREDFVRMEIVAALERKIRVIPVLVGGARMPRRQDLPEALAPLSRRNAIELSETRFHADVSRLIEAIEKARASSRQETAPFPTAVTPVAKSASAAKMADQENLPEKSALRPFGKLRLRHIVLAGAVALVTGIVGVSWFHVSHREIPFVNSLGMRFAPVPGTRVLFSIWDTRVQDFRTYAREVGYVQSGGVEVANVKKNDKGEDSLKWELDEKASWERPGFEQGDDHPVVGVSWDEAKAFCLWLTQKERKAGKISQDQEYRLPTDKEWSAAVGESKYPWGNVWPPPEGAGNYADDALMAKRSGKGWSQVPGNDGYPQTNPVGAFKANRLGLYDIGGNVWQWCEDWYRADMNEKTVLENLPELKDDKEGKWRVQRGASWNRGDPETLLSSFRSADPPDRRMGVSGFRCVVASGSSR